MLSQLKINIESKYPNYINKTVCELGCPSERADSYNCNVVEEVFLAKVYINIESIHREIGGVMPKICDGIRIMQDSITFIEITVPFVSKKKMKEDFKIEETQIDKILDSIAKEFADKIEGTKQILEKLILEFKEDLKEEDLILKFRPVFKRKPVFKSEDQMEYDINASLFLDSIPVKNIEILKYMTCPTINSQTV